MLTLHNIKPSKGATKKRRRVGRGNASGRGTYSGRGQKGQKSRSGGRSGLKRLGMKPMLLQTPKLRGFKSAKPDNQVVNVRALNVAFKDGATVSPRSLLQAGLIKKTAQPVKILGTGELKVKKLQFTGVKVSDTVKIQVQKTGGTISINK